MATTPRPFSRIVSTNPDTNRIAQDIYDKLNVLQTAIQTLQGQVSQASKQSQTSSSTSTSSSSNVGVVVPGPDILITSTAPITGPVSQSGQLLTVRLTQDSVGHAAPWSAVYRGAQPVPTDPNKVSTYLFEGGSDGHWWLVASQIGMPK